MAPEADLSPLLAGRTGQILSLLLAPMPRRGNGPEAKVAGAWARSVKFCEGTGCEVITRLSHGSPFSQP